MYTDGPCIEESRHSITPEYSKCKNMEIRDADNRLLVQINAVPIVNNEDLISICCMDHGVSYYRGQVASHLSQEVENCDQSISCEIVCA